MKTVVKSSEIQAVWDWADRSLRGMKGEGRVAAPPTQSLSAIPRDIGLLMARHLTPAQLLNLSSTSTWGRTVASDPDIWLAVLSRHSGTLPRDTTNFFMRAIAKGERTYRDFYAALRMQIPAALVAPEMCRVLPSATAQYPQVMHISGTGQRSIEMQFPVLPAGKYLVVWRIRAAPAFLRGYVSFVATFERTACTKATPRLEAATMHSTPTSASETSSPSPLPPLPSPLAALPSLAVSWLGINRPPARTLNATDGFLNSVASPPPTAANRSPAHAPLSPASRTPSSDLALASPIGAAHHRWAGSVAEAILGKVEAGEGHDPNAAAVHAKEGKEGRQGKSRWWRLTAGEPRVLKSLRSRMLGMYSSSWQVVDRHVFENSNYNGDGSRNTTNNSNNTNNPLIGIANGVGLRLGQSRQQQGNVAIANNARINPLFIAPLPPGPAHPSAAPLSQVTGPSSLTSSPTPVSAPVQNPPASPPAPGSGGGGGGAFGGREGLVGRRSIQHATQLQAQGGGLVQGGPQQPLVTPEAASGGWTDVVVGSIRLHRPASVAFKFVMLQVARNQGVSEQAVGGLYIDYISLQPAVSSWAPSCFMGGREALGPLDTCQGVVKV